MRTTNPRGRRGSALLAVLWLSFALSTIALTVAGTVRGEIDRAATAADDTRAYFPPKAPSNAPSVEWGRQYPGRYYQPGLPLQFQFPGGEASVEVIPESSKININTCTPADFFRLLSALGVPADRAQLLTDGMLDWRTASPGGQPTAFDSFYLARNPSFLAPHTSFLEIEDLLNLQGMTPELFYGTWERDQTVQPPRLTQRLGLRDCVSIYANGTFDVNTTPPPVLLAMGVPPDFAAALVAQRRLQPFTNFLGVRAYVQSAGPAANRLSLGGISMFTLRATARPRIGNGTLSDMRRSVSALIKLAPPDSGALFHILRWYDRG